MALGIRGTGPYGAIRKLQEEINNCKYELSQIRRVGARKSSKMIRLEQTIIANRSQIREIKRLEKKKRTRFNEVAEAGEVHEASSG